jgi:transposase
MPCYVGLDASKHKTSICIMDKQGKLLKQGEVETSPAAIIEYLRGDGLRYARIGIEASNVAAWLCKGLAHARLPAICIESRHAHGALRTRPNKTDKSDARGIADLMRVGSYRAVHIKSRESQQIRALLSARNTLRAKARDLQNAIRGFLLNFGYKLPLRQPSSFSRSVERLISRDDFAKQLIGPLLDLRSKLEEEAKKIEDRLVFFAKTDPVCRNLTTAPGVGFMTALIYRSAIDDPSRFTYSRSVGPHFGLVPRTFQSGLVDWRGGITKHGDRELRRALYISALASLRPNFKDSWLKAWGARVESRRGRKRALIAVARRLAVVLHRMWVTGAPFRWEASPA